MKSRDIKALPIVDHGDTDAVFIDDVAAIIERGDFSQVILPQCSLQPTADFPPPSIAG